jgi:uncharacterized protein YkvS
MMDALLQQTTEFQEILGGVVEDAKESSSIITSVIIGMQFQDRTMQYIQNAISGLEEVCRYCC